MEVAEQIENNIKNDVIHNNQNQQVPDIQNLPVPIVNEQLNNMVIQRENVQRANNNNNMEILVGQNERLDAMDKILEEMPNEIDAEAEGLSLCNQLRSITDNKINDIFEKIKQILLRYSSNGHSRAIIYFARNTLSNTYLEYDIRINNFYNGFSDPYVRRELIKKLKSNGLKIEMYDAIFKHEFNKSNAKYTGTILELKWKKDYSERSCSII